MDYTHYPTSFLPLNCKKIALFVIKNVITTKTGVPLNIIVTTVIQHQSEYCTLNQESIYIAWF